MATYPDLPLEYKSKREAVNFTQVNYTGSGTIRLRNFQAVEVFEFDIVHKYITQAEAESVYDMWVAGKTDAHSFTYKMDSTAYTVRFKGPPDINRVSGALWQCKSKLIGSET